MREILFRGKRIDNGEWVEGAYMPHYYSTRYGKVAAIFTNEDVLCKTYRHPVDPATVGQYTGLTDKCGTKIFEGDVVDAHEAWWDAYGPAGHSSPVIPVRWNGEICGFDPFADYDCDCGVYIYGNEVEVLGNIHDNPELLKKER